MPPSLHTPLARFMAGALSLTGSAAAGNALGAATAGLTISTPVGFAIIGTLAAFAGGAAIYKGHKQTETDTRTAEAHTYLEQLIKQHGTLVRALAAVPDDIPLNHAESCDHIRRIAAIFTSGTSDIQSRLQAEPNFTRFVSDSMSDIEETLNNQQHDLDRLIRLAINNKNLSEDQLNEIDAVSKSLGLLHEKANNTLETVHRIEKRQEDQLTKADLNRLESSLLAKLQGNAKQTHADQGTNQDLESAVQRLADDAERGVYTAQRVLESNDPNALPTYLKVRRERLLEAKAALDLHIQAEAMQLDREIAAAAFVTGQIDDAMEALARILEYDSNDFGARNYLGIIYMMQGKVESADQELRELLTHCDTDESKAIVLGNIGLVKIKCSDLNGAIKYFEESLALNQKLNREDGIAYQLGNIGFAKCVLGDIDGAVELFHEVIKVFTKLNRPTSISASYTNLGVIEFERGNFEQAENFYKKAFQIDEEIGFIEGMATVLGNWGAMELSRGKYQQARVYIKQALSYDEQLGRQSGVACGYGNLGLIERSLGKCEEAKKYYKKSVVIAEQIQNQELVANGLGNLGVLVQESGDIAEAEKYYKKVIAIEKQIGRKSSEANALANLGIVLQQRNDSDGAKQHINQAMHINEHLGRKVELAENLGNLGLIEFQNGNLKESASLLSRARDLFAEVGAVPKLLKTQMLIDKISKSTK